MRRMRRRTAALLALLALAGCGPTFVPIQVMRKHVPPPVVREAPAVGILQVHVEDAVLETAPHDFLHVSALVVKAARDHLSQTGIPVEDFVDPEDAPVRWARQPARKGRTLLSLDALPPPPFGVKTPLVTLVEVWRWTVEEHAQHGGGGHKDRAAITLLLSTWTLQGEPVCTEVVSARAVAGDRLVLDTTGDPSRVDAYLGLRARQQMPDDTKALFWTVLREAVGLHFAALLPYRVPETRELEMSQASELDRQAFLREYLDAPLRSWTRRYQAKPGAHGALYNAALVHMLQGDDEKALPLLRRAAALNDSGVYRRAVEETRRRVEANTRMRKQGIPASEWKARASTVVLDGMLPPTP
jgi:hypothetical protein